jgi:membrane protein required for colicin V production
LNTFDVVLLVLACVLVFVGMLKGLVRILIGLAALIAAFILAARYHQPLSERLSAIDIGDEPLRLLAYLMIFLGVMIAGGLIAYFLRRLLKAAMLGWADRLAGAALGLVAAMLFAALIVLPIVAYSPYSERVLAGSLLAPYVTVVADLANQLAPEELSRAYRRGVEDLRRFWSDNVPEVLAPEPNQA